MHEITFTPMRMEVPASASIAGDTLTVNGTPFDLATPGACPWLVGQPVRAEGGWQLTLIAPHGGNAPFEARFPEPVRMAGDGAIPFPPFAAPQDGEAGND